jgi:protein phosphatase
MIPIQAGDRFLLCSDGLTDYVTDDVIGGTLRTHEDRQACAAELISRTLEAGAPDNVTVIVCDVVTT